MLLIYVSPNLYNFRKYTYDLSPRKKCRSLKSARHSKYNSTTHFNITKSFKDLIAPISFIPKVRSGNVPYQDQQTEQKQKQLFPCNHTRQINGSQQTYINLCQTYINLNPPTFKTNN